MLSGGPWSFDNYMLVLNQVQAGVSPDQIPLVHMAMWVQIHELPIGFMTQNVGVLFGNFIGEFMEYDTKNNTGVWRSFMRIRVKIDARVPLKTEKKVKKPGGEWKVVHFKYERLGVLCFVCGLIGHTEHHCDKLLTMDKDDGVRGWGLELRVETRKPSGGRNNLWLREGGKVQAEAHANPYRDTRDSHDSHATNQGRSFGMGASQNTSLPNQVGLINVISTHISAHDSHVMATGDEEEREKKRRRELYAMQNNATNV